MSKRVGLGPLVSWSLGRWQRVKQWAIYGAPFWKWILYLLAWCAVPIILARATGYPSKFEDQVRLAGLFLQLVGLVAIVRDLDSVTRGFGGERVLAPAKEFWTRLLHIFRGPRIVSGSANLVATAHLRATGRAVTVLIESHGTIEERVKSLEEWRKQLVTTVVPEIHKAITDEGEKIRSEIAQERLERDAREKKFADTVKEAMVGDLRIKLGGFAYVLVGTILTSIPFS